MDLDVIIYAMQLSVESNSRNINYIKAILNSWSKKGIKTLIEAREENNCFKNKNKKEETEEEKKARKIKALEEMMKNDIK